MLIAHPYRFIAAMALPLAGCSAQAESADDGRFKEVVTQAMCATAPDDRSASLELLADAIENYQPRDEEDSAVRAINRVTEDFNPANCPRA